jgi:hypothetical protein
VRADLEPFVDRWAARIRPHLAQAVEGIVAAGRELVAAREVAPHGAWGPLCAELGLTTKTAWRFMEIGRNPVIANRAHASDLPPAWTTLFELSRMEPGELGEALEDGVVTPEMGRGQAANLAGRGYRRQREIGPAPVDRPRPALTGRCPGCRMCEGCLWHWTAERPRDPDLLPVVYIDAHGIAYDTALTAEEIDEENAATTAERWQPVDKPDGRTVHVLRRELTDCGIGRCPPCTANRASGLLP